MGSNDGGGGAGPSTIGNAGKEQQDLEIACFGSSQHPNPLAPDDQMMKTFGDQIQRVEIRKEGKGVHVVATENSEVGDKE